MLPTTDLDTEKKFRQTARDCNDVSFLTVCDVEGPRRHRATGTEQIRILDAIENSVKSIIVPLYLSRMNSAPGYKSTLGDNKQVLVPGTTWKSRPMTPPSFPTSAMTMPSTKKQNSQIQGYIPSHHQILR